VKAAESVSATFVDFPYQFLTAEATSLLCSNNTLSCGPHVNLITTKTAASLDAVKTLRCHGLDNQALWDVTQATLVAQLLYASPFWRGFINAEETN